MRRGVSGAHVAPRDKSYSWARPRREWGGGREEEEGSRTREKRDSNLSRPRFDKLMPVRAIFEIHSEAKEGRESRLPLANANYL